MGYKVIHYFADLQDFNHVYNVGDSFPRIGMKVSEERLRELSGSNNKQNKPLISWEDDESVEEINTKEEKTSTPIYTKTDINRMSTSELKDLAKKNGISDSDDMTGAELKRILIDYYSL